MKRFISNIAGAGGFSVAAAILVVGLVTALYAALAAIGQDDIKRVLAYSTISQLGFMFLALGLRAYAAAIFLLVTHAFYKALMFLSAGSVMHGMHDETDMKRMGGLRPLLPVTSIVFTAGALALSGVPPFAGFFSKDQIVAAASATGHPAVWVLATVGAFLSALYISRLISLTFLGARRSETGVHESPVVMTAPLGVLAVLSVTGGLLGLSATSGRIQTFLAPVLGDVPEHGGGLPEPTLVAISIVVASAGVALGWWLYGSGRVDWLALRNRVAGFQRMLAAGGHYWNAGIFVWRVQVILELYRTHLARTAAAIDRLADAIGMPTDPNAGKALALAIASAAFSRRERAARSRQRRLPRACSASMPRPVCCQRWPTPTRTGTRRGSQVQTTPRRSRVSAMICRQASPSRARPISAPCSRTACAKACGWVAPTPSLMLIPFGLQPIVMTCAPNSCNTAGAI